MEKAIAVVGVDNRATNQIEPSPHLQNRVAVDWAKARYPYHLCGDAGIR